MYGAPPLTFDSDSILVTPTQAAFAFHHACAFAEGGHEVQIFLLGEGVTVMRSVVANSIHPVGWPPLSEALQEVIAKKIPIHV